MSAELKPCPYCGCDLTIEDRGDNLLVFLCPPHSSCIGSGLGTYAMASKRDTAIEQYNRRRIRFESFESGANAAANSPALESAAATRTATTEGKSNV